MTVAMARIPMKTAVHVACTVDDERVRPRQSNRTPSAESAIWDSLETALRAVLRPMKALPTTQT